MSTVKLNGVETGFSGTCGSGSKIPDNGFDLAIGHLTMRKPDAFDSRRCQAYDAPVCQIRRISSCVHYLQCYLAPFGVHGLSHFLETGDHLVGMGTVLLLERLAGGRYERITTDDEAYVSLGQRSIDG